MNTAKQQLLLVLGVLLLYAAFLTRTYYWDGVLFALNIEAVTRRNLPFTILFHPNHLLYSAFGYLLYAAALACRLHLRAITVLQLANTLMSALAGAVLFSIAKRITASTSIALFCWILFAFGATWWKFSTDADPYIPAILLLLLAMRFLLDSPSQLLDAAACHIAAMLFHELSVFFYAPVLVAIALEARWTKAKKLWVACAYVVTTAACVSAAYLACYAPTDHITSPSPLAWITSYASNSGFTRSWSQFVSSNFVSYIKLFGGGRLSLVREYFSVIVCLSLFAAITALIWAIRLFRTSAAAPGGSVHRGSIVVLWAWLLPCAAFLASWDPGSAFHKLFVWPPIVLLIGSYIASRNGLRARCRAFIALAVALAAWNFAAFIFPHWHSSADPVLTLAQTINQQLPKDATVYYRTLDTDDWYLEYFAPGRRWLPLPEGATIPAQISALRTGAVCLETTALESFHPETSPDQTWELVNSQHNVRLACWTKPG